MVVQKHVMDEMTPVERVRAWEEGKEADRVLCVPFMGEMKCKISGISVWDFWHVPKKMADAEIIAFNRYGYDRMSIGPNSRGITEALGGAFIYPENGLPYAGDPLLKDLGMLDIMEPADASAHPRLKEFSCAAEILTARAAEIVPIEVSIGGPFTIASNLRGVEQLLRDLRRHPKEVHRLMDIVMQTEKSCIDMAALYGAGIAMADPVANPGLIGPRMYEEFVCPYTKELTDYAFKKTGRKVSLHMCGRTYSIWKYLSCYELNELSLDNIIDLKRAAEELGKYIPIAGNVDPVEIVMNGTKEEITQAVKKCIDIGLKAEKGYVLATGCDIPYSAPPEKVDYFMETVREYRHFL